jgi:acetyl-CoA C-acetyltransferase
MEAALFSRRVAVVASAQTGFREAWRGRQHVDLISEVVAGVLRGSGIGIADVDFVIDSGSDILDGRSISNCGFLGAMGAHHKEESRVEEDGLWSALYGVSKIAGGSSRIGLLVAYSKPSEGDLAAFYATQCEPFYQRPVGFDHLAASGIQAQQYLARHSLGDDALAGAVARNWANAHANPHVEVEDAPSAEDVLASEVVAAPLRRLEMSRPVDGAVAVLIADAEVAGRVSADPVWITGMGTAIDQHAFSARALDSLPACDAAAKAAYRSAGFTDPKKADLVETGAGSIVGEVMVLESLGLAEPGHGLDLHEGGGIAVNPSGGSLPADPVMATGLVRLADAAHQVSGQSSFGPADAKSAIVHGTGGVGMQNHCVFVLEA